MNRGKLYKEQYDLEWSHRSHLLSMTNFCIVAATIVGTTLVAEMQSFDYSAVYDAHKILALLFVGSAGMAAVFVAIAIVSVCKALIGHEYKYLPSLGELNEHYLHIESLFGNSNMGDPDIVFGEFVNSRLIEAADANFDTNMARAVHIERAMKSISWSLGGLAFASLLYLLSKAWV